MAAATLPSYVPALRMKAGELAGLRDLAPDVADRIRPRLIVPSTKERDGELQAQLFKVEDDPDIADALAAHWGVAACSSRRLTFSPTSFTTRSGDGCPRCLSGRGMPVSPPFRS
jgi:hypothetical protein